jgi:hypothetical protein
MIMRKENPFQGFSSKWKMNKNQLEVEVETCDSLGLYKTRISIID